MPVAMVTTIIRQEIEVPEGWDRMDVFDFLGEHQSFRTAFQGVSNEDQTARIIDIMVLEEEVTELGDVAYDD
jgi:hypothetical protein